MTKAVSVAFTRYWIPLCRRHYRCRHAIFEKIYPNGNYPLFVGVIDGVNKGAWGGNTADNQAYYVNQLRLSKPPENDYSWRIVLAFSAVPAAATMYFRLHMAETPRYTLHVLRNATTVSVVYYHQRDAAHGCTARHTF
jgi:hypothetical protein